MSEEKLSKSMKLVYNIIEVVCAAIIGAFTVLCMSGVHLLCTYLFGPSMIPVGTYHFAWTVTFCVVTLYAYFKIIWY